MSQSAHASGSDPTNDPSAPSAPGGGSGARGKPKGGTSYVTAIVLLALGFALVPRAIRGLRGATSSEAPEFAATFIANAPKDESGAIKEAMKLSELRGKPVLLDFWATWCGPCQAEMPIVNGIAERFRDQGLVVVGVNTSDEKTAATRFIARRNVHFPIIHDDGNEIAHKFQVENLPTLVLVSKDGKIEAVRHGVTSDADLERIVKRAL